MELRFAYLTSTCRGYFRRGSTECVVRPDLERSAGRRGVCGVRTGLSVLAGLLVLGCALIATPGSAGTGSSARTLVTVDVAPSFEPLRHGVGRWLHANLEAFSVDLVAYSRDSSSKAPGSYDEIANLCNKYAAQHAVYTSLVPSQEGVSVELRLVDGISGDLLHFGRADGSLGSLGESLRQVLAGLVEETGGSRSAVDRQPPPRVDELSIYGRAHRLVDEGRLPTAWRSLAGIKTRTATSIRAAIDAANTAEGRTPAERSRLATASGRRDADWLKIREAFRKAEDPGVLLAGGDAALARKDPKRAAEFYENAVKRAKGKRVTELRSDALLGWATALSLAGEAGKAQAVYARLRKLTPEDALAYTGAAALGGTDAAELWRQAGNLLREQLRPRAAKRAYQKALDAGPTVLPAMVGLALSVGDLDAAADHLAQAQAAGVSGPEMFAARASLQFARGELDQAERNYRAALEEAPDRAEIQRDLGRLLLARDQVDEARGWLEASLEGDPADGLTALALAEAWERGGSKPKAIEVLRSVPAGAARPSERNFVLGRLLLTGGEAAEALVLLENLAIRNESRPEFPETLAKAAGANGQRERVEEIRGRAAFLERLRGSRGTTRNVGIDQLVRSFPKATSTGTGLGVVGLLGLEERRQGWDALLHWFSPRTMDLSSLSSELSFSLSRHYQLVEVVPPSSLEAAAERLQGFADDLDAIVELNEFLSTDGLLVGHVVRDASGTHLETRLLVGDEVGEAEIFTERIAISEDLIPGKRWNRAALVGYGILLLIFAIPALRGWGTLIVTLDEESANSASFHNIQLNRRANRSGPGAGRQLSRFTRRMVGAETIFRFLPARVYYVGLTGSMQDGETGHTIGNSYEEKAVRVIRGQTITLHFDCKRSESALEVTLVDFDPAGPPALVALSSEPGKVQSVDSDSVVFFVPDGSHEVVVGYGDRAYRKTIRIEGLSGGSIGVHLGEDGHPVFENCQAAVKSFVRGDFEETARILVQEGQEDSAMQILGEYYRERGEHEQAAHFFKAVGMREQAAEAGANTGDAEYSAKLFEEAGDFQKAAVQHREAGDLHRAAAAHEAAYEYDAAIDCYRQAGDLEAVIALLERTGDYYEAARTAVEANDLDRAITNFQQVGHKDSVYGEASRTLAHIFAERGEYSLAVERLEAATAASGGDDAPLELLEQLGHIYEKAADFEAALATFETIRKRDFHYDGLEERLGRLRPLVSRIRQSSDPGAVYVAETEAPSADESPDALGGERYEILEELGRGGMGVVYKAQDTRLHRTIALKQLHENVRRNPTAVQLFLREARAAASLNHQNIVTLYDVDHVEGNYYFTMEMLEGQPLDAILADREKLSPKDALRISTQICNGLHYAHDQRVVHRDIKTSNLFFTHDRVVKIMDFGLAKMMEEVRRAATMIGGTPYYMSPEQAAGGQVDHRADLYSLGVTIFELVTGSVPFKEGHVAYHHQHTPPPDPRELAPDVPAALAELIQHMMGKLPEDRPSDAAEVAAKLVSIYQDLNGS